MTETEMKLRDASTQMLMAHEKHTEESMVRSCVNSYISNARSATMVMEKESSKNPVKKEWYKSKLAVMGEKPLFRFFHQQRTYTIHKGVVQPKKVQHKASKMEFTQDPTNGLYAGNVTIPKTGVTFPFHKGDIVCAEASGIVWGWYFIEHKKHLPNHSGNVFALCEEYYTDLKALFLEWCRVG